MGGGRGFGTVRVGREPLNIVIAIRVPFIDLGAMSEGTQAGDIRLELPTRLS